MFRTSTKKTYIKNKLEELHENLVLLQFPYNTYVFGRSIENLILFQQKNLKKGIEI